MPQTLAQVTLLVRDYDEAIVFFTQKLGFSLIEDTRLSEEKRWVVVKPPGYSAATLLIAKASTAEQRLAVGKQSGDRVFLFLHTNDFWHDYRSMQSRGVKFLEFPRQELYGTVAVFEDLSGNKWDLLMPAAARVETT